MSAANNMNMGAAAGAFKEAGNEDFISFKNDATDRAYPITIPAEAVKTAFNMHETILAAVQRRESGGAYCFSIAQLGRAYGANLGITRGAYTLGFGAPSSLGRSTAGRHDKFKKEGGTKPEQKDADKNENYNLKSLFHGLCSWLLLCHTVYYFQCLFYILSVLPLEIWGI